MEYIKKEEFRSKILKKMGWELKEPAKIKILKMLDECEVYDIAKEPPVTINFIADDKQINKIMKGFAENKFQLIQKIED